MKHLTIISIVFAASFNAWGLGIGNNTLSENVYKAGSTPSQIETSSVLQVRDTYQREEARSIQSAEVKSIYDATPATAEDTSSQTCNREREAKDWCYNHSARRLSGQAKQRMCRTSIARYNTCIGNAGGETNTGDSAYNNVENYRNPDRREAYVNGSANCRQRSNDSMTCLICNCHNEAGIEDREGKVQVNRTVLARVASPSYPNSICGVIWQRAQFSWTLPQIREDNVTGRHYNACYHAAKEALAEGSNGACFYHGNYVSPRWARNKRRANVGNNGRLGRHIFYRC